MLPVEIQSVNKHANTHRSKIKGRKMIFQANKILKWAGKGLFLSDKIAFKTKTVREDK